MTKNYLQLEFGSGLFFDYSKDEKQGYEKHTSSKGNVSYRKYYKEGITGILESVSIYEGKFGNQISMNIKNGEDVYYVPIDIADQKGNVDTYAESLIKFLPQLEKGMNISVRAYNFKPEGEQYAKIGVSISVNGEKIKSEMTNAYINREGNLVKGNIPAITWKKDALGKNKPTAVSLEAKNDYLLEVLKVQTDRLKWVQGESSTTTTPQPKAEAQVQNAVPQGSPKEAFEPATNYIPDNPERDKLPF
jgi:hypothetical protein